ncbi:DUF4282 domain-containing protein [Hyphomonas sp. WL0036]|uniref:DUF4282 domain-containing protein n=1 Tax=Hyphomonas sediminis TaxID=2866160 RepID=UPI001C7E5DE3|nr:DUF4282 domain-containing protein [Hyphomonas sediminis]MBY9066376.1 DUF4282 domain-containing protein [Hyphomonas sediminis]
MINYFIGFDKLIGTKLITILYYLGLLGIALGIIAGVLSGLGTMVSYSFFGGIGLVIGSIIGGVLAVLFWRFMCELYLLFFRMAEDVREIKNGKTTATTF